MITELKKGQDRVLGNIPAGLVSNAILLLIPDQDSDLDLELWNTDGTVMLIGNRGAPDGRKGQFLWSVRYRPSPPDGPYECKDHEDCKGDIFWWTGIGTNKGDEEQININGPQATNGHLLHSYQVRVFCAAAERKDRGEEPTCKGELRFSHQSLAIFWGFVRGPEPTNEKIMAEVTFRLFDNKQAVKIVSTDEDGMLIAVIPEGKYYLELKPKPLGYSPLMRDPRPEIANFELAGGQTFFRGIINIDKIIPCVGAGETKTGQIIKVDEAITVYMVDPNDRALKDNKWRLENVTLTLQIDERPFVEHDLLLEDAIRGNPVPIRPGVNTYQGDKITYSGPESHPEQIKIEEGTAGRSVQNVYYVKVKLRKRDASYKGEFLVRRQCELKSM
jgi:hypothetical protein